MKLLLDTHALLWWFVEDPRLTKRALSLLDDAEEVYFSMVSLWEVGIKMERSGFDFSLDDSWEKVLPREAARYGMAEAAIEAKHCRIIAELPRHHGDPFDRMLIAQALSSDWTILGKDRQFDPYEVRRMW